MMDIRANFTRQQNDDAATNRNSTKSFKRFTRYFIILQARFESFEKSDQDRYNDVRRMNLNAIKEQCQKIMDCDKRIHEQQLGIAWQPPTDPVLRFQDGPITGASGAAGTSVMESSKAGMS